ncbi:MAG: phosphatase PAP2 family protein [Treponema sp.]|jgi:membrane-associated phospholipid phosphatase|nr:phosphatase PAP2 family protein [Treponema sp.]
MMEPLLLWGLDIIRTVQEAANPPLTFFMKAVTHLGSVSVYVILLSLMFWCIDEKKSFRLGAAVLISGWINLALKFLLNQPRPFWEAYDPAVGFIHERFGGLPSGHAQSSLVMWIIAASWGTRPWQYAAAVLLVLLIGFSRIYLGVHFPTDVFAGWLMGGLVCAAYFFLVPRIEKALENGGLRAKLVLSAAVSFVMILYRPADDLLMPGAVLLGMGTGYSLNVHILHFRASGFLGRRGAAKLFTLLGRLAAGAAGIAIMSVVFGRFLPGGDSGLYRLFFFLQYALAGFWVYAGAPWLFQRTGLAEPGTG